MGKKNSEENMLNEPLRIRIENALKIVSESLADVFSKERSEDSFQASEDNLPCGGIVREPCSRSTYSERLVQKIASELDGGVLRIYSGPRPNNPDAPIDLRENSMLAEMPLRLIETKETKAFFGATSGKVENTGTASFARCFAANGVTPVCDLSVGEYAGSDLRFSTVYFVCGDDLKLLSLALGSGGMGVSERIANAGVPNIVEQKKEKVEAIDHPKHYLRSNFVCNGCGRPVECIEIVEHLGFNHGNAMKYLWRLGEKGGFKEAIEDLKKAAWYCTREAERLEREAAAAGVES